MIKIAIAAAAAASALRCGPIPASQRTLPAGTYRYESAVLLPGAADSLRLSGRFVVDTASADSLVGRWEVRDVDGATHASAFDVVGWRVVAEFRGDSLRLVHSVKPRGAGLAPGCFVGATKRGFFVEGRCSLRPVTP